MDTPAPQALAIARIDESTCIGCTLCIVACPFDAIVGAAKRMHTVLPALCTGCALCLPPCPVDCIDLAPAGRAWSLEDARAADARKAARDLRVGRADAPSPARRFSSADGERDRRRAAVAAALARARARRLAFGSGRKSNP